MRTRQAVNRKHTVVFMKNLWARLGLIQLTLQKWPGLKVRVMRTDFTDKFRKQMFFLRPHWCCFLVWMMFIAELILASSVISTGQKRDRGRHWRWFVLFIYILLFTQCSELKQLKTYLLFAFMKPCQIDVNVLQYRP